MRLACWFMLRGRFGVFGFSAIHLELRVRARGINSRAQTVPYPPAGLLDMAAVDSNV